MYLCTLGEAKRTRQSWSFAFHQRHRIETARFAKLIQTCKRVTGSILSTRKDITAKFVYKKERKKKNQHIHCYALVAAAPALIQTLVGIQQVRLSLPLDGHVHSQGLL
jgi:ABC-type anion transport system duplicated permease subunit